MPDQKYNNSSLIFLSSLIGGNIPFAVYRMPFEEKISLLVQYRETPGQIFDLNNLDKESGFIVAPFPGKGDNSISLLQPDLMLDFLDIPENLLSEVKEWEPRLPEKNFIHPGDTPRDEYESQVAKAVEAMERGDFFKVVLSRVQTTAVPENSSLPEMYMNMCTQYPRALAYMFYMPHTGLWMGATPEPLLVSREGRLKTVSLAGTQVLGDRSLDQIQWGEKEIAEQAIVSRFIVKLIDNLGIENYDIKGPSNFRAGALVHLNTEFYFNQKDLNIRLGEFMDALHPTPSICGLPRNSSLKFIHENEKHERSYYSGMLGPVNLKNETHLYVNLRCMRMEANQAVMYSGAGITVSSVPEKEWDETTNKLQTVKKVLNV